MSRETEESVFHGVSSRDRARLSAQISRIRAWVLARQWFTLREAREDLEQLYAPTIFPESSISAQLRNLEKAGAGRLRCKKEKRRRKGARNAGVWEYRLRALPAQISAAPSPVLQSDEPLEKITWPATFEQLEDAGYGYTGTATQCSCGERFLWFITPARKWMPMSALANLQLVPHRVVCANAKAFREANARHRAQASPPAASQQVLFAL